MTTGQVMEIFREAMILAFKLTGPLLLVSMLVGLIIAIFQAATQVHEQTLTFVPKLFAIAVLLLLLGPWMAVQMQDFMSRIFDAMIAFA